MGVDFDSIYMIKTAPVAMIAPGLSPGYFLRPYEMGSMDPLSWARIEVSCDEFPDLISARAKWNEWTQCNEKMLVDRCFFLMHKGESEPVGTVTAWVGIVNNRPMSRLHWLAIKPEHQGKKLARPLVAAALERFRGNMPVYLKTQMRNKRAINLYFSMGFEPLILMQEERNCWRELSRKMGIVIPGISQTARISRGNLLGR